MLAVAGEPPRAADAWAWEFKHDGQRGMAAVGAEGVLLHSRTANPLLAVYPELAALEAATSGHEVVLDGEIVAVRHGRIDFGQLQRRMHRRHPAPALVAAVPVIFVVFDLLGLDREDLTTRPYLERRRVLDGLDLARPPTVQVPPYFTGISADELLPIAREHGVEGLVAKRLSSSYRPGRSHDWIKITLRRTCDVVIGGWIPGSGRWSGVVGALLCGMYDEAGALAYVGRVGSGLSRADRATLAQGLADLATDHRPFGHAPARSEAPAAHWVQPVLVAEVEYREMTNNRGQPRLRQPSWRGLRVDIAPEDVTLASAE